jgi:hypothetical protein
MSTTSTFGASLKAVLGTVHTTANVVTNSLDSLNALSLAANTKANDFLHATKVTSAVTRHKMTRNIIASTTIELARQEREIAKQLDSDPELKAIFERNLAESTSAVASALGTTPDKI